MLVLDAILTGAKGVNLWSSFRVAPPQRKSRLYTALFERGLASQVNGALLATADPFLYTLSFTPNEGVSLPVLEEAVFSALEPVADGAIEDSEVVRGKRQLRARLVFEDDSVTNVAHQLGFFETVVGPGFYSKLQPCIDAVTPDQVRDVAQRRLRRSSLTVGVFQPLETQ
jgi:zinc protease